MRRMAYLMVLTATVACAGGSRGGGAATPPAPQQPTPQAPSSAAATVMRQAAEAEPPKPKDIDPTGSYGVALTYGGQPLSITVQFTRRDDGSLAGAVYADQVPSIPLSAITVSGKRVQASLTTPDGAAVVLDLTIDGDAVSGSWRASNGDGSQLSGRRIP